MSSRSRLFVVVAIAAALSGFCGCGDASSGDASGSGGSGGSGATGGAGGSGATGGTSGGTSGEGGTSGSGATDAGPWPTGGTGGAAGASGTGGAAGGGGVGATGGTAGAGGTGTSPVDCSGIEAHGDFELCDSGPNHCAGVFTNSNGCDAFCAAAGLTCAESYGGEPGCQGPELQNPLNCGANTGHQSDWCRCEGTGGAGGSGGTGGSGGCATDPGNPPTARVMNFQSAVYTNRPAWVLECRDYAYTAVYDEHEACDSLYQAGSGSGTAAFTFDNVPTGMYDVYFQGRHTVNRNPQGALVIVSNNGQSWSERIMQNDDGGYEKVLHGTYCLSGTVTVLLDSTTSASDSVQNVYLEP